LIQFYASRGVRRAIGEGRARLRPSRQWHSARTEPTQTVFQNDWPLAVGLTVASPFHASFDPTCCIERPRHFGPSFAWFPAWIVVQAIVALALLLATLATFDRCIGRMRG
jgi:hypothetical protein